MALAAHGRRAAVTAPDHRATQAGLDVLGEGGNAVEAVVAMAATASVVFPHMTGIGGDGFWLVDEPGEPPWGLDGGGPAAAGATPALYSQHGLDAVPARGPLAALTIPGAVASWQAALARTPGRLPLARLLAPAAAHARDGWEVSDSQAATAATARESLEHVPGLASLFLRQDDRPGALQRNTRLADVLERLGQAGLDDFYRGEIGRALASDLTLVGSPLRGPDLTGYQARPVAPLSHRLRSGRVYNLPPPTQGLASLIILALFERLEADRAGSFEHLHGIIEATRAAFAVRDRHVTDPAWASVGVEAFLDHGWLDDTAAALPRQAAGDQGSRGNGGDTAWFGACDADGRSVSFIQSLYWGFGSGVVSTATGVVLQNRGHSFHLTEGHPNRLAPGRRPFHTLNPALAHLDDGRTLAYGAMGGDGQPQTQAALFSRHVHYAQRLADAIDAPRWLLGRSWGEAVSGLRVEGRIGADVIDALRRAGHEVTPVAGHSELMGHAGAVARGSDGRVEAATDPRSNGAAAAL